MCQGLDKHSQEVVSGGAALPDPLLPSPTPAVVHLRMFTSSSCPSDPLRPPSPPLEAQPGLRSSFSAHSQEVEAPLAPGLRTVSPTASFKRTSSKRLTGDTSLLPERTAAPASHPCTRPSPSRGVTDPSFQLLRVSHILLVSRNPTGSVIREHPDSAHFPASLAWMTARDSYGFPSTPAAVCAPRSSRGSSTLLGSQPPATV
ncbi:uncharacterized protein LOC126950654 [Macaca thibetana thibetana]|uniref:uncharacterized protein LOC126950654 n=1 Tax=Macaca thibetana thibetana TaxID=257877 RepID=UPI0021BCD971|nr:uncharacterized protein LOC126950654 [Macaca thibetana thibetana]